MRKMLLVLSVFYSIALFADTEHALVPGTIINSFVVPGGPPPTENPPVYPWVCTVSCTPESIMQSHEEYLKQTGQDQKSRTRSIAYYTENGNINSKTIDDE